MATIDLCTLDDLKRVPALAELRALATDDPHADEHLQQLILAFSDAAERETGRWFRRGTYTEVLDVEDTQYVLQLRAYPLVSITSIKSATDGNFAAVTALDATSYALVSAGRTGQVKARFDWVSGAATWFAGPAAVQVVYVGGYATEPSLLPADLRMACAEQCAQWWLRSPHLHLRSQGQSGGSASYFANDTEFLPSVRRVLDGYRLAA